MITANKILALVSEKFALDGVYIVELAISPSNQIVLTIDSNSGIPIDYCVTISKLIESSFDREVEDFELEVGTPGTDAFKVLQQYQKYIGKEVEILLKAGKKLIATLLSADEQGVVFETIEMIKAEGAKRKVATPIKYANAYSEIKSTKPVINFK